MGMKMEQDSQRFPLILLEERLPGTRQALWANIASHFTLSNGALKMANGSKWDMCDAICKSWLTI